MFLEYLTLFWCYNVSWQKSLINNLILETRARNGCLASFSLAFKKKCRIIEMRPGMYIQEHTLNSLFLWCSEDYFIYYFYLHFRLCHIFVPSRMHVSCSLSMRRNMIWEFEVNLWTVECGNQKNGKMLNAIDWARVELWMGQPLNHISSNLFRLSFQSWSKPSFVDNEAENLMSNLKSNYSSTHTALASCQNKLWKGHVPQSVAIFEIGDYGFRRDWPRPKVEWQA